MDSTTRIFRQFFGIERERHIRLRRRTDDFIAIEPDATELRLHAEHLEQRRCGTACLDAFRLLGASEIQADTVRQGHRLDRFGIAMLAVFEHRQAGGKISRAREQTAQRFPQIANRRSH